MNDIDWEDKYRVIVSENTKLRMFIDLKQTCWTHVGWCGNCPYNGIDEEHCEVNCTIQDTLNSLSHELNIATESD